jgi:hypothetical protein
MTDEITEAAMAARENLPDDERRELDAMTRRFADALKERHRKSRFGVLSGAALWGKLGMWLNERE